MSPTMPASSRLLSARLGFDGSRTRQVQCGRPGQTRCPRRRAANEQHEVGIAERLAHLPRAQAATDGSSVGKGA